MEKTYTFNLNLQQAQVIIAALKKQPMEQVENVVLTLDNQFIAQVNAEKAAAEATQDASKANDVVNANPEVLQDAAPAPVTRRTRKTKAEAA